MKKIIVIILVFILLPKIYSQNTITRRNINIFIDGQFLTDIITGNFSVNDTANNIFFSFPFTYISDNIEFETKYHEMIKKMNSPIIQIKFELKMRLLDYTPRTYNIDISRWYSRSYVNIKIYNRESKTYRKYFRLKTDYIVDIRTGYGWGGINRIMSFLIFSVINF
jgi:hypothetical protein